MRNLRRVFTLRFWVQSVWCFLAVLVMTRIAIDVLTDDDCEAA